MSIKVENTLNEIRYAGGIYSAKPIETTATASFGAQAITGNLQVGGTLGVTGAASLNGGATILSSLLSTGTNTFASGLAIGPSGPQILVRATDQAGPTASAPTGSLCINSTPTGTVNRIFINTNNATGWTALTAGA